jgi:hypothetical protein
LSAFERAESEFIALLCAQGGSPLKSLVISPIIKNSLQRHTWIESVIQSSPKALFGEDRGYTHHITRTQLDGESKQRAINAEIVKAKLVQFFGKHGGLEPLNRSFESLSRVENHKPDHRHDFENRQRQGTFGARLSDAIYNARHPRRSGGSQLSSHVSSMRTEDGSAVDCSESQFSDYYQISSTFLTQKRRCSVDSVID